MQPGPGHRTAQPSAVCGQGVDVVAVHGDKDQLERLDAIKDFKTGVCMYVVCLHAHADTNDRHCFLLCITQLYFLTLSAYLCVI